MTDKKEIFGQELLYIVWGGWLFFEVLLNSTIDEIFIWKKSSLNNILAYIFLVLLMIHITFIQEYSFREIIIVSVISLLIIVATVFSHNNIMISAWLYIIGSKYIHFDKTVQIAYWVQILALAIVVIMYIGGAIPDTVMYRSGIVRHSYGCSNPNQLGIRVFMIMTCRCFLRKDRLNYGDAALVMVISVFVNRITNSQTAVYSLFLFAILLLVYEVACRNERSIEILSNIFVFLSMMCALLSIVLSVIDVKKYPILKNMNKALSYRFSHCHRTLQYYGIAPFGQDVQAMVRNRTGGFYMFYLDNSYMAILVRYGYLVFISFMVLFLSTLLYMNKEKHYFLLLVLFMYSIYGVMENNYFSLSQNVFLFLMSAPIYQRKEFFEPSIRLKYVVTWKHRNIMADQMIPGQ